MKPQPKRSRDQKAPITDRKHLNLLLKETNSGNINQLSCARFEGHKPFSLLNQ